MKISRKGARAVTWTELLEAASEPDDVLRVARDFLARWEPSELAALPGACQPSHFDRPEDLVGYAFTLVQYQCRTGPPDGSVDRMAAFFANAARRVAIVMDQGERIRADNQATD